MDPTVSFTGNHIAKEKQVKIVLQHIADRQVYAGGGLWRTEINHALSFESTEEAIDFALHEQLYGVQILIHLDVAHLDLVVPCCVVVSSQKPCEV